MLWPRRAIGCLLICCFRQSSRCSEEHFTLDTGNEEEKGNNSPL